MDCKAFRCVAASFAVAALASGCASPKNGATSASAASRPADAPLNAPAASAGTPAGVPLDAAQRAELDRVVAAAPAAIRARLRYALATADDGKSRLVVYDGEGLPADGHHRGRPHEYVVFQLVNSTSGEHYDPQQNAIVPPIPPPVQRDSVVDR